MKVWLVTEGEYSEYGIVAAFSTKAKARVLLKRVEHFHPGYARIEEYELDATLPSYRWERSAWISREGKVEVGEAIVCEETMVEESPYSWGLPFFLPQGKEEWLCLTIVAKDGERETARCAKIANEKRAIILANNLWGDERGLQLIGG